MFDLFGLGRSWAGAFHTDRTSDRQTVVADAPISAGALKINSRNTSGKAHEDFRDASTALRAALGTFSRETKPVYTTTVSETRSTAALTSGRSARIDPFNVDFHHLQTTSRINTQTDTSRASTSAIGLDVTSAQAASTTLSTAEMSTEIATAYGSSNLTFVSGNKTSTSTGTLTGTYTGVNTAANATSLTVKLKADSKLGGGILGLGDADTVEFEVTDQTGTRLFQFEGSLSPGQQVYLGDDIGLSISFSAGDLKKNHTASTTVTKTPITVDANATFNASAALRPKFDNGAQVTAGSFTINGTSIAVNANDSINSVISRINSSAANVTASVSGDKVTLRTNGNSEDAIVMANDTSGFLAATKLSGAATTAGNVRDDQQVLSKTSQFGAVTTGAFSVNGVSIAVNRSTDSLSTVIGRINSSGAGVTASYDSATDRLVFTPDVAGATMTIDDDTSGFLAAANVVAGTLSTEFNADAVFNAPKKNAPMFDPGLSVTAGSFTVNGVAIAVAGGDSVNTVLAKITASAAGVTATYDAATQRVTLDSKDGGTGPITVGGDTSGFLAAVKLDGTAASSVSTVSYSSFTSALGEMAEYASVTAGTLTVNGQDIAIDPATTTIDGLVTALNGLSGVAAQVNETSGTIDIWSETTGTAFTVADTSGLLDALGLAAGTYKGTVGRSSSVTTRTGTSTTSNSIDVATKVSAAVTRLNDVFAELGGAGVTAALEGAIDRLRDKGIRGLTVTGDGAGVSVSVDRDELVNALNALGDDVDLAAALDTLMDDFTADVTAAAGWDAPEPASQTVRLADTSRAQLAADQTATSLLFLRSSLQPQESEEATQKAAMKAYAAKP